MTKLVLFLSLFMLAQVARAEPDDYIGVGGAYMNFDDGAANESKLGALILNFGHRYREKVVLETRIGTSLTESDIELPSPDDEGTTDVLTKLDYLAGVYAKFTPFGDNMISPYLIGGYTLIRNSFSYSGGRIKQRNDSLSAGLGIDICGTAFCGNVEITRYINDHDFVVDAAAVGFSYRY